MQLTLNNFHLWLAHAGNFKLVYMRTALEGTAQMQTCCRIYVLHC